MAQVQESVSTAASAGPGTDRNNDTKLVCRGLWKVFGDDAAEFVAQHGGQPTWEQLSAAGLIGAVRDANLEVRHGEIFVIMGLSGSGKSTIVRCLSRLVEPTTGELLLDGRDLLSLSEKELSEIRRHEMGMVFQHFALLPHLSVLHNVAFPLEVQGVDRAKREARAMEMIELVGLDGRESYFPRELSGGQQQRVGIARSLAGEPDIWFLDEPFSALDPLIRREMQNEFLHLQEMLHKTIVFITHDFDEAIRLADRIAIMKDGLIVQVGTPEEVVTEPATDYVAEFTRDVAHAKVLSARSLMTPLGDGVGAEGCTERVDADARVIGFADRIVRCGGPFAVVDRDGAVIGRLEREAVVGVLAAGGDGGG